jgi:hypothetical protein
MLVLAALFVGAVVAFGRWQGIRSLVGLGLSFLVIVGFVVPAILRGHSPVLVAVIGAMAIMLLSLYLSHGTGPKTTAAVVGTALAGAAIGRDHHRRPRGAGRRHHVPGLLVTELHHANPTAGMAALVAGALRVGRDHIAATVNTLFLAYAGAALPLLIVFVTGTDSLSTVATTEVVAVEIVRALCGSVGLIAAVPLTTVLAALVATEDTQPRHSHATARGVPARAAEPAGPADTKGTQGRSGWGLTRGLSQEQAGLVLDRALAVHGPTCRMPPSMSTAAAGWPPRSSQPQRRRPGRGSGSWSPTPSGGRPGFSGPAPAAWSASTSPNPSSWTCYAASAPSPPTPRVWVQGDPTPVIETGDSFGDLPRFTYRLEQTELEHIQASLAEAGLAGSTLVPAGCARPSGLNTYRIGVSPCRWPRTAAYTGGCPGPDPARAPPNKAIAPAGLTCRGQPAGVSLPAKVRDAERRCPHRWGMPGPGLVHTPAVRRDGIEPDRVPWSVNRSWKVALKSPLSMTTVPGSMMV